MSDMIMTSEQLRQGFDAQQQAFDHNRYPEYAQRLADLQSLKRILVDNQEALLASLSKDFGHRSCDDSIIGDILSTLSGIKYHIKNLKAWMKPRRKHVGLLLQPASARVMYQPLGVIGIIVPWNYPVFLSIGPLATALAAGNRAMLKMSEYTPHTNALLAQYLSANFAAEKVCVVGGEADMAVAFSQLPFDHLFFTGSTAVGKHVLKAAAENMVPVTLELGGKSPGIIAHDMPIETAVQRFLFGKTLNAGQTCVAPDYLFCPSDKLESLIQHTKQLFTQMFPSVDGNQDYTCVINQSHYERLQSLLNDAEEKGAKLFAMGEKTSDDNRRMPLTIVTGVTDDMRLAHEEIFGPILIVYTYEQLQEPISYINQRPRPLSLYVYSFDKAIQNKVLKNTIAGGVCVNDASFHVANEDLPFGGVGASGMGNYHGEEGFIRFSHAKSILSRGKWTLAPMLFPPYGTWIHKLAYKLFIR